MRHLRSDTGPGRSEFPDLFEFNWNYTCGFYDATLPLSAAVSLAIVYRNLKFTSFGTSGNSIIESLFGQIILIMGQKVYDMHNSAELFYDRGWISSR